MNIHSISTAEDHRAALARIEALWRAEPGTDAGDELDILVDLVEHYEERHFPLPVLEPIELLGSTLRPSED